MCKDVYILWVSTTQNLRNTVLFPERLADGREFDTVCRVADADGSEGPPGAPLVWIGTVEANESGGWTMKCFDQVGYSYLGQGIPRFIPRVPQPRAQPVPKQKS